MTKPVPHELAVIGGGLTGLMMATTLAHTGASVTLIDRTTGDMKMPDERTTTINAAGVRMLQALGVWQRMAEPATPVMRIAVAEGPAPTALAARRRGGSDLSWTSDDAPMAYVVSNGCLLQALADTVATQDIRLHTDTTVTGFTPSDSGTTLTLQTADGHVETINIDLIIACDGANSLMAKEAGLVRRTERQTQTAICTTLVAERHHGNAAYQRFLSGGPFALMPGPDNSMSLVWTLPNAEAERLIAADSTEFETACMTAFGSSLGYLHLAGNRLPWRLQPGIRKALTGPGILLAGDAAHAIHPLAGQGYNLALADAAVLADLICMTFARGLTAAHGSLRSEYENRRRPEIITMSLATSGLNRLFFETPVSLRRLAGLGFSLLDRLPAKTKFSDIARGGQLTDAALLRGDLPGQG